MQKFTIHVMSLPHTRINSEYSHCAFTQKAKKLSKMMYDRGHTVYLYGSGEDNHDFCTEYIPIINDKQFDEWFPKREFLDWNNAERWTYFNPRCAEEIRKRSNKGDIAASTFGNLQEPAFKGTNCIPVETGIGYTGVFAPFRIYESYAIRNFMLGHFEGMFNGHSQAMMSMGQQAGGMPVAGMSNPRHEDTVIPNKYDLSEFEFNDSPEDYFFFIGRLNPDKGFLTAARAAKILGKKLKLAGVVGDPNVFNEAMSYGNVEYIGILNSEQRKEAMKNAIATFVPSQYLEPFGGVHIESLLSGTPVITSDAGVFPETVQNGFNGYRCNTLAEYVEAGRLIKNLDRKSCYDWAVKNFSLEAIAPRYEAYFDRIYSIYEAVGTDSLDKTPRLDAVNSYFNNK